MEVKRLRTLGFNICKTPNKLNPALIEKILCRTKWLTHRPNIQVNVHKTTKYGGKSLGTLAPHIWNLLLQSLKAETNFIKFKENIDQWFGPIC